MMIKEQVVYGQSVIVHDRAYSVMRTGTIVMINQADNKHLVVTFSDGTTARFPRYPADDRLREQRPIHTPFSHVDMIKHPYLLKDPYGEPKDEFERTAKDWLMKHNGTEGRGVMESLAAILRAAAQADSIDDGRAL
jgi:hypothetical protein